MMSDSDNEPEVIEKNDYRSESLVNIFLKEFFFMFLYSITEYFLLLLILLTFYQELFVE